MSKLEASWPPTTSWTVWLIEDQTSAALSTVQTISTETTITMPSAIESRNDVFIIDQGSIRVSRSRARRPGRGAAATLSARFSTRVGFAGLDVLAGFTWVAGAGATTGGGAVAGRAVSVERATGTGCVACVTGLACVAGLGCGVAVGGGPAGTGWVGAVGPADRRPCAPRVVWVAAAGGAAGGVAGLGRAAFLAADRDRR